MKIITYYYKYKLKTGPLLVFLMNYILNIYDMLYLNIVILNDYPKLSSLFNFLRNKDKDIAKV
jgi:hypothetical protein